MALVDAAPSAIRAPLKPGAVARVTVATAAPLLLAYAMGALGRENAAQFLFVPVLATALVALLYGVRHGLLASVASMLGLAAWVFEHGPTRMPPFQLVRLVGAGAVSLLVAWAMGSLREAYRRAADERAAALAAARQLAIEKARAERAVELRDDVLAVVSHDLKSPLAAITVSADLLERRLDDAAPDLARHASTIRRRAADMSRLIADLLDAAAIEAGRLSTSMRPASPAQIGRDAVERHAALAEARGVSLSLRAEEPLPALECDPDRVVQLLSNLLANAVAATPAGGTIVLGVEPAPGGIRFVVEDTGSGIDPEDLPHLFDRFRRGRSARHAGSGLGLAIVRGIAEAHGGTVSVESAPGRGTRFTCVLPAAPRAGALAR